MYIISTIKTFNFYVKITYLFIIVFILTSCDKNLSNYYNSKAEKLESEGKYEEAILLLNKSIKKNPQNIYALINRGVDNSLLDNYQEAIDDYTKVIEISPNNELAYLNRGKNKARLEDYRGAINDFDEILKIKGGEDRIYIEFSENSPFLIRSDSEFNVSRKRYISKEVLLDTVLTAYHPRLMIFTFVFRKILNFKVVIIC